MKIVGVFLSWTMAAALVYVVSLAASLTTANNNPNSFLPTSNNMNLRRRRRTTTTGASPSPLLRNLQEDGEDLPVSLELESQIELQGVVGDPSTEDLELIQRALVDSYNNVYSYNHNDEGESVVMSSKYPSYPSSVASARHMPAPGRYPYPQPYSTVTDDDNYWMRQQVTVSTTIGYTPNKYNNDNTYVDDGNRHFANQKYYEDHGLNRHLSNNHYSHYHSANQEYRVDHGLNRHLRQLVLTENTNSAEEKDYHHHHHHGVKEVEDQEENSMMNASYRQYHKMLEQLFCSEIQSSGSLYLLNANQCKITFHLPSFPNEEEEEEEPVTTTPDNDEVENEPISSSRSIDRTTSSTIQDLIEFHIVLHPDANTENDDILQTTQEALVASYKDLLFHVDDSGAVAPTNYLSSSKKKFIIGGNVETSSSFVVAFSSSSPSSSTSHHQQEYYVHLVLPTMPLREEYNDDDVINDDDTLCGDDLVLPDDDHDDDNRTSLDFQQDQMAENLCRMLRNSATTKTAWVKTIESCSLSVRILPSSPITNNGTTRAKVTSWMMAWVRSLHIGSK